ncbi:unnamed protein product [Ixodes hexagonus]
MNATETVNATSSAPMAAASVPCAARIFVGGLDCVMTREDLEREFGKYGALKEVWMAQNPPGFAFVEFEDNSRVDEAVREMNGTIVNGALLRVERARDKARTRTSRGGGATAFRGRARRGAVYQGFGAERKTRRPPAEAEYTGTMPQASMSYGAGYSAYATGYEATAGWEAMTPYGTSAYYATPQAYGAYYGDFYTMTGLTAAAPVPAMAVCDPAMTLYEPQEYSQM